MESVSVINNCIFSYHVLSWVSAFFKSPGKCFIVLRVSAGLVGNIEIDAYWSSYPSTRILHYTYGGGNTAIPFHEGSYEK